MSGYVLAIAVLLGGLPFAPHLVEVVRQEPVELTQEYLPPLDHPSISLD